MAGKELTMKNEVKFHPKKDRSFIASWYFEWRNTTAIKQACKIAKLRCKSENLAQYVVPIGNKYVIINSAEKNDAKSRQGKAKILAIDTLLKKSIYIAYPQNL
jgi:hypothetical protein